MSITYGLITSWYLNFLDFVMIYIVINRLIGYSVKNTFKQTTFGIVGTGILLGAVLGSLPYFTNMFLYQAVMFIVTLSIALWIVKKRKEHYPFDDMLVLYFLYYLVSGAIVLLLLFLFSSLGFGSIITQVITYTLACTLVLTGAIKLDLYKLFIFVSHKIIVKTILFNLAFIAIFSLALVNFDSSQIVEHALFFGLILAIILVGLGSALKLAYHYMEVVPDKYHDTKKLLMTLYLRSQRGIADETEISESLAEMIELMGIRTMQAVIPERDETSELEAFILDNIESLKLNKKSNPHTPIISKVRYRTPHKKLSETTIVYMLNILLENALETMTKRPIFINLIVTEESVLIRVENEAFFKTKEHLEKLLLPGFSTKGRVGRGYGLAKLKKLIQRENGKIEIEQSIHVKEQVDYIAITLYL